MLPPRLIQPDDYAQIFSGADSILQRTASQAWPNGMPRTAEERWNSIGVHLYCSEASDAVTRVAHDMGIVAVRQILKEGHLFHAITSFAPLEQLPAEHDLVFDGTWGQLDPKLYRGSRPLSGKPFFGLRRDLALLVPGGANLFDPSRILFSQIIHAPQPAFMTHKWLDTTHEQAASGMYPMGVANLADFPELELSDI